MKRSVLKRLSVSALALAMATSMLPAMVASAYDLDCVFVTRESDGKQIWFEADQQMGVYGAPGNVWFDGTERGKEIYDPASDAWYWLDTVFEGAKATGKEVFMPYVYGNEATFDSQRMHDVAYESNTCEENAENAKLGYQIWRAMQNGSGKWVRYDGDGRMLKGWITIEGALADIYPDQAGNTYYYDQRTGVMAKGIVQIGDKKYEFDRVSGKCLGETQNLTDEEEYYNSISQNTGKTLCEVSAETVYATPRMGDRDYKTVYIYGNAEDPTHYSASENYTKINGEYVKTGESQYKTFSYQEGNYTYTSNRPVSSKNWTWDEDANKLYLYSERTYEYDENSLKDYNSSREVATYYTSDGQKNSVDAYEYSYDSNGNRTKSVSTYEHYTNGVLNSVSKYETTYSYNEKGQQTESVSISKATRDGEEDRPSSKYTYHYDENGNRVSYDYYYYDSTWDSEKQEYVDEWKLNGVYQYTYRQIAGTWKNVLSESFGITNGVRNEQASSKYEYIFDEATGKQTESKGYDLVDGQYVLTSRALYQYDNEGYRVYYRSYRSNSSWDSTTGTYKYGDLAFEYGYDEFYENILDPSYTKGYRHAETKEIYYSGVDADGKEEVNYYVLYDTGFSWNVGDLEVGATKTRVTRYYNADDSDYYTYTETYEVKAY